MISGKIITLRHWNGKRYILVVQDDPNGINWYHLRTVNTGTIACPAGTRPNFTARAFVITELVAPVSQIASVVECLEESLVFITSTGEVIALTIPVYVRVIALT